METCLYNATGNRIPSLKTKRNFMLPMTSPVLDSFSIKLYEVFAHKTSQRT